MREMMILFFGSILAVSLLAGPANLRNEKLVKERHAEVEVAKDAVASGTYASIWSDLDDVGSALDAIDLSTVTNSVFTGDQKVAIIALKKCVQDLKVASKNLMQTDNKLVKKLKETERIYSEAR